MTQKVSKEKVSKKQDVPSGTGKDLSKIWSYIRFLYQQNDQAWTRIAQLEQSNVELRNKIGQVY